MLKFIKNLFRVAEIDYLDKTISDLRETIAGYQAAHREIVAENAKLNRRNAELVARNLILTRDLAAARRSSLIPDAEKCA